MSEIVEGVFVPRLDSPNEGYGRAAVVQKALAVKHRCTNLLCLLGPFKLSCIAAMAMVAVPKTFSRVQSQ
jgi:hypothetical protein